MSPATEAARGGVLEEAQLQGAARAAEHHDVHLVVVVRSEALLDGGERKSVPAGYALGASVAAAGDHAEVA